MAEVKKLEAEVAVLPAEQRLVGLEADVAPGVEIKVREAVRQGRDRSVIGRGGEVARALDDVRIAERRRAAAARLRRVGLGGRAGDEARAGCGDDADQQRAAGPLVHEGHSRRTAGRCVTRRFCESNRGR